MRISKYCSIALLLGLLSVPAFLLLGQDQGRDATASSRESTSATQDGEEAKTPMEEARMDVLPFPPGEKLTYEIRWSIFPVGTATLEYLGPMELEGQTAYKIVLTARTNSFADGFFKVRNYNASWVDEDFTKPLHYVKIQHEGKEHSEVVVTFDWDKMLAQYSDKGRTKDPIDIPKGSWDPLSIVYAVRAVRFSEMNHLSVPTTDGKKTMTTEIAIRGKDNVKVPAGRFDTVIVEPDTKDLGGVFKKSKNAGITIWFSQDERHLPVRMSSSVAVGSFVAELSKIEGPGAENYPQDEEDAESRRGPRR